LSSHKKAQKEFSHKKAHKSQKKNAHLKIEAVCFDASPNPNLTFSKFFFVTYMPFCG